MSKSLHQPKNSEEYRQWIGCRVEKISGKPFKSGFTVATVVDVTTNPHTGNDSFYFMEDMSEVECFRCKLVDEK